MLGKLILLYIVHESRPLEDRYPKGNSLDSFTAPETITSTSEEEVSLRLRTPWTASAGHSVQFAMEAVEDLRVAVGLFQMPGEATVEISVLRSVKRSYS